MVASHLNMQGKLQQIFQRWAAKRAPRKLSVELQHRTIYVFPGKQGLAFFVVVLVIWVLGTNYQNNLILGLSYFLLSLMLVSVIHAFRNLLGLRIEPGAVLQGTLGEEIPFDITISSRYNLEHHGLLFLLDEHEPLHAQVAAGQSLSLRLYARAKKRGWFIMPRIVLKSYYPFGLIRAWAYIELDYRALVFPKSIASDKPPLSPIAADNGQVLLNQQGDEFYGFKGYQPGYPLSQIAWKQLARGAGFYTKDYRTPVGDQQWLDWSLLPRADIELGVSQLAYWVQEFSREQREFGLQLPTQEIPPGIGDVHRLQALTALALLEQP